LHNSAEQGEPPATHPRPTVQPPEQPLERQHCGPEKLEPDSDGLRARELEALCVRRENTHGDNVVHRDN
jgi:hypothetical protein